MFGRHRQPWQCRIITDCQVLAASCPHSVVVKYCRELQKQNQSPRPSPGLGVGVAVVTND